MYRLARWWAAGTGGAVRVVLLVDGAIALILGGLAVEGSWEAAGDHGMRLGPAGVGLVLAAAGGLVVRRMWPPVALGVSLGATLAYLGLGYPYSPILQLTSLATYSVGAWCAGWMSPALVAGAVAMYVPLARYAGGTPWPALGIGSLTVLWLVLPWLAGLAMRSYRRVKARAAGAERREHAYRERLRMAREVHDVVGHSLVVINMQAGVALHVLPRRPERAAEALSSVRQVSAQALDELRALLAAPEPGVSESGPPFEGMARLPELVAAMNHDGLRVRLVVAGRPPSLPAAVDLACYRIVQESLTNVVRHAGAGLATVQVEYRDDVVSLLVTDDGRGPAVPSGAGRGLVGMRERAAAVGGTFTAGARPAGGFEVSAVLPLSGPGGDTSTRR